MPIREDDVKKAIETWLKQRNFTNVEARLGKKPGIDIEGVSPTSGKRPVVECKGETNARRPFDCAWRNVSQALFNAMKQTEDRRNADDVALAFPDVGDCRKHIDGLQTFCVRQKIAVHWVSKHGKVQAWLTEDCGDKT